MKNERPDRRSIETLHSMMNRNVRTRLTSWEKRNIADEYHRITGSKIDCKTGGCGSIWRKAIQICFKHITKTETTQTKTTKTKPILVKEKMVVGNEGEVKTSSNEQSNENNEPLTIVSSGGGWHTISDGKRIRGLENAKKYTDENNK